MSLMNMKKLEEYLPRPEFLRTHRSYIVHMTKAAQADRFRIVFGDQYIPISDSYKDDVQRRQVAGGLHDELHAAHGKRLARDAGQAIDEKRLGSGFQAFLDAKPFTG